jgi:hypothetical protein
MLRSQSNTYPAFTLSVGIAYNFKKRVNLSSSLKPKVILQKAAKKALGFGRTSALSYPGAEFVGI